jgi:hypothetical protein
MTKWNSFYEDIYKRDDELASLLFIKFKMLTTGDHSQSAITSLRFVIR